MALAAVQSQLRDPINAALYLRRLSNIATDSNARGRLSYQDSDTVAVTVAPLIIMPLKILLLIARLLTARLLTAKPLKTVLLMLDPAALTWFAPAELGCH